MKYCSNCGKTVRYDVPDLDDRPRAICDHCERVHYENPRMIVGCIPRWEGKIMLCKRAIEPRKGYWTLPAGFMEQQESLEEGALRETLEEAGARVEVVRLYTVYSVPHVDQVYAFFLTNLKDLDFAPNFETAEVRLFTPEEIPWEELAFSSVIYTLEKYVKDQAPDEGPTYLGTHG